ncbi:MAG: Uma2 family endonuclease [bacterium]|nr:Uma2 family endonuclease [bacterium]
MGTAHTMSKSPPEEARRLHMTYEEFLAWADEDVHAEWVDGEVIVFMPPKTRHQSLVYFLTQLLGAYVDFFRLGKLLFAPFEMRLPSSAREPDILFVSQANLHRLTPERLHGAADLVVEVVSEDSQRRDRVQKFIEYQSAGVREYWLVDSQPDVQPGFYFLNEKGRFEPAQVEEGVFRSRVLTGFWLRTEWLTASGMPDPITLFAEIVGLPEEVKQMLRRIAEEGPRMPG